VPMDLEQGKLETACQWSRFGSSERVSTAAAEGREATVFVPGGASCNPSKRVKTAADSLASNVGTKSRQTAGKKMAWEHNDPAQRTVTPR